MAKPTSKSIPFAMFDPDKLIAAQQRNIDALASASQILVDGAKAIAQRHGEIMQSSMDQLVAAGQEAFTAKPNEFKPADHVAQARSAYELAINNARELSEIVMKAQSEATAVLTKCAMANIDDLKSLAKAA
jgi:phasin family protein